VRINVSTDPVFPAAASPFFWTNSPFTGGGVAWYVHLDAGYSGLNTLDVVYSVRCVR
jgi:hypothetical protein